MAQLVLRLVKGSPITDPEMDSNFTNLNRDTFLSVSNSTPWVANTAFSAGEVLNILNRFYLVVTGGVTANTPPTHTSGTVANGDTSLQATQPVHYSAKDVLDKIKTLDGVGSGLDADYVRGLTIFSALPTTTDKSSIVVRDAFGNFAATTITANLAGNSTTASNAALLNNLTSSQILEQAAQRAIEEAIAAAIALG